MKKLNRVDRKMRNNRRRKYKIIRRIWRARDQARPYLRENIRVSTIMSSSGIFNYPARESITIYAMNIIDYEDFLTRSQRSAEELRLKKKLKQERENTKWFLEEFD